MDTYSLKHVRGAYSIAQYGNSVVITGSRLWIFKTDGTLVAYKKDIVHPQGAVFLPEDRMLVSCGKANAYILFDLKTGNELLRIPAPNEILVCDIVASQDRNYVYGFSTTDEEDVFLKIDTKTWETEMFPLQPGIRAMTDLLCDEEDYPCILSTHQESISGKHLCLNGIRYVYKDEFNPGSSFYWKYQWHTTFPQHAHTFFGDTETIITNDLYVYKPGAQESYYLIENSPEWVQPDRAPFSIRWHEDNNYLTLCYNRGNVVVDIKGRKVVAQYAAERKIGCLINGEYWVGAEQGVQRKPFPLMEEIPPDKHIFWRP